MPLDNVSVAGNTKVLPVDQATGLPMKVPDAHVQRSHIPALDGVRGLAVIMVMVFHFYQYTSPEGASTIFTGLGRTGVDLFFVLSGFLITSILIETKGSNGFLHKFYMRRILRIFPLYYAALLIYGVWDWWHLAYLQNVALTFTPGYRSDAEHFWSLAVEEHFYLAWPFLIYFFDRAHFLRILSGIILVAILIRFVMTFGGYDIYFFTLGRMDALAIGSLLAVIGRERLQRWQYAAPLLLVVAAALLLPLYLILSGTGLPLIQTFKYTIIASGYAVLLVVALTNRRVDGLFGFVPLRSLGKYSYALYVFHPLVFSVVMSWSVRYIGTLPRLLLLTLCVSATFAMALISWNLFERHFLRLKEYFNYA